MQPNCFFSETRKERGLLQIDVAPSRHADLTMLIGLMRLLLPR